MHMCICNKMNHEVVQRMRRAQTYCDALPDLSHGPGGLMEKHFLPAMPLYGLRTGAGKGCRHPGQPLLPSLRGDYGHPKAQHPTRASPNRCSIVVVKVFFKYTVHTRSTGQKHRFIVYTPSPTLATIHSKNCPALFILVQPMGLPLPLLQCRCPEASWIFPNMPPAKDTPPNHNCFTVDCIDVVT